MPSDEFYYKKAARAHQGEFPTTDQLPQVIEDALGAFGEDFRYAVAIAEDAALMREKSEPEV
jgi:hypothetical protein